MNVPDILAIVRALNSSGVKYVLIGEAAMMLHGSVYVSYDTNLCYAPDFKPALGVSTGETLPFFWDARTLTNGGNFTLATTAGDLDILAP